MYVLGVDPGCHISGYSIIKKELRTTYLVDCGYVKFPAHKPLVERIALFHDAFKEKIVTHSITDLALETPFLGKNAQNFLKLGYLRGILYLLAHQHNLRLHEFTPTQVKQAVTGFGGASKDQVARIILQLFPKLAVPEKADVTDAVAVSLCGLWHQPQISR